jgi:hypothetical protein
MKHSRRRVRMTGYCVGSAQPNLVNDSVVMTSPRNPTLPDQEQNPVEEDGFPTVEHDEVTTVLEKDERHPESHRVLAGTRVGKGGNGWGLRRLG